MLLFNEIMGKILVRLLVSKYITLVRSCKVIGKIIQVNREKIIIAQ